MKITWCSKRRLAQREQTMAKSVKFIIIRKSKKPDRSTENYQKNHWDAKSNDGAGNIKEVTSCLQAWRAYVHAYL
jgi:hypothetical protein